MYNIFPSKLAGELTLKQFFYFSLLEYPMCYKKERVRGYSLQVSLVTGCRHLNWYDVWSLSDLENDIMQSMQLKKGFSPEWTLKCIFNLDIRSNDLEHWVQRWGENDIVHWEQQKGFSSAWTLICSRNLPDSANNNRSRSGVSP
jgi:hypothetical protein